MRKWWHLRPQLLMGFAAVAVLAVGIAVCLLHSSDARTQLADRLPPDARSRLLAEHAQGLDKLKAAELLAEAKRSAVDCAQVPCIALTFDDGPNPLTTPQVLAILEQEHVAATFFIVGSRVAGNEALLQRMHHDGDEIGDHSWNHPDFTKLTPNQIRQQISQTQAAIISAGVPAPTLFRPPYGAVNQTVKDNVDLTFALWNEDPKDWAAGTSAQVIAASEASAKAGGVIDMHDIYHVTANALQPIIDNLKGRQFHFVTMSQLMAGQPLPPHAEFYGRP